jgi:spermidine/putrescine transport system substrate-binding protein
MTEPSEYSLSVLTSRVAAERMSRRIFLKASAGVALAAAPALLSACGSSGSSASAGKGLGSQLDIYNWAQYDSTDVLKKFTHEDGPVISVDTYNSNEEMVAKLIAASGTTGYDMCVPTGIYIPEMVSKDLLMELDLSRIPNFPNLLPQYRNQPWDPGNKHSVCKDFGSVGWLRDTTKVRTDVQTWSDFITAAQTEASRETSLLDSPTDVCGIYFWSHGIDFTTTKASDLDACEHFLVNELAPHIKNFDVAPDAQGTYALSQAFSGTARVALNTAQNPNFVWGLGAPRTEFWMDNWCILKNAPHVNAAYAWISFIYEPTNAFNDMLYHGTNPGIKGVEAIAKTHGVQRPEMIFFTEPQLSTMQVGAVNSATPRLVSIFENMKAAAASA